MSSVIVLVGSARKGGNTDLLARAFADGASGHHEVELVSVADYKVKPCSGCNGCCSSEGHRCVQKDDMAEIYEKLKKADAVVVASPVYFLGISAQLKALVDRLHTPMRSEFRIKKLGLILVAESPEPGIFDPIVMQYRMLREYFGLEDIGMVLVNGAKEKGDVRKGDGLKRAHQLGESLQQ